MYSIMVDFLGFRTNSLSVEWFPDADARTKRCLSFTIISCVAATTWKFIIPYLGILSLNLNKLGRQVFDWNAILNEQEGSWFRG